ncbi:MAG TPA: DUF4349 domain-containing protein [Dehalococcoidia bacterium]|nr:DUF4349 domain-containing protein [Dehalococcoidia bacterium]
MLRPLWVLLLAPALFLAACASAADDATTPPQPPEAVQPLGRGGDDAFPPTAPPSPQGVRPAPPAGDQGGALSLDDAGIERKVVYTARLDMEVDDVDRAVGEVQRVATALGGLLVSANVQDEGQGDDRRRVAEITVRVPADVYTDALAQLRRLASRVRSETAQSKDVTEEYADLEARLRNLRASEARYLELLAQARNVGEVLQVQDRLNAVRLEIERVQGRMNLLQRLSDMATITVHLAPPPVAGGDATWHPSDVAADAWGVLQAVFRALATAAIYFAIAGGWIAALLALGVLAWRRWLPARRGA